ncbi:hypothetical protein P170DRAFT_479281 [Aspergillus steynii IBT 23096]|uniref:Yeast cell wall synthesis Kre9/Knh1-like N-terminal domain-containing protein n=1 Tax=Aspergillus steynii IBT 23096 TaxID=1392250 RepID=A0A2I2FVR3_9EURO|nr:uncharacterized protein P170DRAFT_479281 [Aspergillus steynii IBT 23096]PLB44733.1 hypothetical protein P170DRAFT_479281 [Aspergillus steynii IBT 23096]
MRSSIFYLTLSAIATLAAAAADKANPFNIPADGYSFKAGEPTTLKWNPTTSGTVTLRLQWGGVLTPNSGTAIAKSIDNSGSFTWTPSSDLAAQPDYTVEIISDDDTSEVNYLPRFVVAGATGSATKTTAASTTSATTTEASTTTSSSEKTTSTSGTSSTSSASKTETPTTLSTATSTGSSTSTKTGSGGEGSASSTGSATGSSSAAASSTSAQASSTNSATASASETVVPNTNAGTTTRVSGAMMALVLAGVAVF